MPTHATSSFSFYSSFLSALALYQPRKKEGVKERRGPSGEQKPDTRPSPRRSQLGKTREETVVSPEVILNGTGGRFYFSWRKVTVRIELKLGTTRPPLQLLGYGFVTIYIV